MVIVTLPSPNLEAWIGDQEYVMALWLKLDSWLQEQYATTPGLSPVWVQNRFFYNLKPPPWPQIGCGYSTFNKHLWSCHKTHNADKTWRQFVLNNLGVGFRNNRTAVLQSRIRWYFRFIPKVQCHSRNYIQSNVGSITTMPTKPRFIRAGYDRG